MPPSARQRWRRRSYCDFCGRSFFTFGGLMRHLSRQHPEVAVATVGRRDHARERHPPTR